MMEKTVIDILKTLELGNNEISQDTLGLSKQEMIKVCSFLKEQGLVQNIEFFMTGPDFSDAYITLKGKEYLWGKS